MNKEKRRTWSDEEKLQLKDLYETKGLSASEIAPLLCRTHASIKIKIDRWNLHHSREQELAARSRASSGEHNGMFGKEGVNLGKTKETHPHIADAAAKISKTRKQMFQDGLLPDLAGVNNPMYGVKSWSNGLTKETDERLKCISQKMSVYRKTQWLNMSDEQKDKRRQQCAAIGIQKKTCTSIEKKIHVFLTDHSIPYQIGFNAKYYTCDVYIPDRNLIIECQGDYWHANPERYDLSTINRTQSKNVRRDKAKKTYLTNLGYELLYLWEYDINYRWGKIEKILIDKLKIAAKLST